MINFKILVIHNENSVKISDLSIFPPIYRKIKKLIECENS